MLWLGGAGLRLRQRRASPTDSPTLALSAQPRPAADAVVAAANSTRYLQDQDRLFGGIASVRTDIEHDRLSAALRGIDGLRGDAAVPTGLTQLAVLDQEAEDALSSSLHRLGESLVDGAAPTAAAHVRRLVEGGVHRRVDAALRTLVRSRAWPRLHGVTLPVGVEIGPALPLPAGRRVRVCFRDAWCEGTTVAAAGVQKTVTVRVQDESGVFFPVMAQAMLAPIGPDPAELRAQVVAAVSSGDAGLTSAWLAATLAREVPLDDRVRRQFAAWFVYE